MERPSRWIPAGPYLLAGAGELSGFAQVLKGGELLGGCVFLVLDEFDVEPRGVLTDEQLEQTKAGYGGFFDAMEKLLIERA